MSAEIRVTAKPADIEVTGAAPLRLDIGAVVSGGGGASVPDWWRGSRYLNLLVSVPQDYDVLGTPTLLPEGFVAYYVPQTVNDVAEFTSGSVAGLYAGHSDGVTPAPLTFLGTPEGGDWFLYRIAVVSDGVNFNYTFGEYLLYVPTIGGGPESPVSIGLGNVAGETSVDTTNFTGNLAGLDPANVQEALAVFDAYAGGGGAAYAVGDVATYNGETWYRLDAHGGNVGDTPVEGTYWTKVAAKGDTGATGVVAATAPITYDSGTKTVAITAASTSAAGSMSSADKTKLDGIASGATANSSDATLLARANHTGTQAAATITGLAAVATSGSGADLTAASVTSSQVSGGLARQQIVASSKVFDTTSTSLYSASSLVPVVGNSSSTLALALGTVYMVRAQHDGATLNRLCIVVTATSLTGSQAVTIAAFNDSGGMPTTRAWSQTITVGTSTGALFATSLSLTMPVGPCWIAILNPSGNAGTVTLRSHQTIGNFLTVANDASSAVLGLESQSSMPSDVSSNQLRTATVSGAFATGNVSNTFPKIIGNAA